MARPIKSISNPKLSLNILTDQEVRQIHEATLEVIETVGVRFPSPVAIDILESHGAQVDRTSMVARIPADILDTHLAKAPPT